MDFYYLTFNPTRWEAIAYDGEGYPTAGEAVWIEGPEDDRGALIPEGVADAIVALVNEGVDEGQCALPGCTNAIGLGLDESRSDEGLSPVADITWCPVVAEVGPTGVVLICEDHGYERHPDIEDALTSVGPPA